MLDIKTEMKGDTLIIRPEGFIDATTAQELQDAVDAGVGSARRLCFDFAGVPFISSAGLRVILRTDGQMKKKGGMTIINVCEGKSSNEALKEMKDQETAEKVAGSLAYIEEKKSKTTIVF